MGGYTNLPNNKVGKIRRIAAQIINIVAEKRRVKIPKLALELGYNPHYLKYAIMPVIEELSQCITREGNELVWVCEDGNE
ncbi:MAG: hypothetical protein QXZ56_07985 [Sulfolobales archaeon]